MTRFTLNARAIAALANIRGDDDTRPALQGVHLAPDGTMTAPTTPAHTVTLTPTGEQWDIVSDGGRIRPTWGGGRIRPTWVHPQPEAAALRA